jgi:hydroxypyruvate isomerase
MPRFGVNVSFLFGEHEFLERFAAAADAGFGAVEYMSPYEHPAELLRARLEANGLRQLLFNLPMGDFAAGERGFAGDPARADEFRAGVADAVAYAQALDVPLVNCLAGSAGDWDTLVANVAFAAGELAAVGRTLVVEAANTKDVVGFLVPTAASARRLIDESGAGNARVQFDTYHAHREEGDVLGPLEGILDVLGHVQIADDPGRHQPGTGEIDLEAVLARLDAAGYDGYVSLEYVPEPDTLGSLGWLEAYDGWRER